MSAQQLVPVCMIQGCSAGIFGIELVSERSQMSCHLVTLPPGHPALNAFCVTGWSTPFDSFRTHWTDYSWSENIWWSSEDPQEKVFKLLCLCFCHNYTWARKLALKSTDKSLTVIISIWLVFKHWFKFSVNWIFPINRWPLWTSRFVNYQTKLVKFVSSEFLCVHSNACQYVLTSTLYVQGIALSGQWCNVLKSCFKAKR